MADPLVSRPTLDAFEDYLARWSIVRIIQGLFDEAGIACDKSYGASISSDRRRLFEQYVRTVDRSDPAQIVKLLNAFAAVLRSIDDLVLEAESDDVSLADHRKARERMVRRLGVDGFEYREGRIVRASGALALTHLRSIAVEVDYPYLLREIDRIEASVESDPFQAIGTAKELLETICRTILAETPGAKEVGNAWTVGQLCGETLAVLELTPATISQATTARETVKALLGQLGQIPQRLAELRNPFGTGHGHEGRAVGLQPRHARLAIGAASTLALFLYESHREQRGPAKGRDAAAGA